jgi:pyruvate dehydrogenase E1 component beta subunit
MLDMSRIEGDVTEPRDAPIERLAGADLPMPYNHHLEARCIPDVPRAVAAIKRALYLE